MSMNTIGKALIVAGLFVLLVAVIKDASADPHKHYQPIYLTPPTTNVTEITEIVNQTNIDNYTPDQCNGVAIAQAGANNTMYMGTKKPQLSIGVGECNGEFASSLMFGMRINNNLLLNGSYAADESVNAFGFGATVVFK